MVRMQPGFDQSRSPELTKAAIGRGFSQTRWRNLSGAACEFSFITKPSLPSLLVAIYCQIIVINRRIMAASGRISQRGSPRAKEDRSDSETLVLSVELRGPLNPHRIDGLDEDEQVAQSDPQSLISTAESVVESLLSGESIYMNRYAR